MIRCAGCMAEINEWEEICPQCGYVKGTPPKEAYHMPTESILRARYIIGRVLGYGGFGVTYIGWDAELMRKVAVKEFLPSMLATRMPGDTGVTVYGGEATEQFEAGILGFTEEAKRLAAFNGMPGVVAIYDTFVENNTAYIIMEFLEGQDVKEIIQANGSLPYEMATEIVLSVCDALIQIHKAGIIHRDISPDNIYITSGGSVKLIDFGAARYETSRNSKSLSVILKSGYAPEEQYRSRGNQGPWSDVYALAATFYKMLTGVTPPDSMERAINDEIKEPSKLGAELPEAVENSILNALMVKSENRTQSVAEFREALSSDQVERIKVKKAKSDSGSLPKWGKTIIIGGLLLLLLLGLLTGSGVIGGDNFLADTFGSSLKEGSVNAPGVVNQSQGAAKKMLEEAGLKILVVGKEYSDKIEKDKVLSQTPLPGRSISIGETVEVVICGGTAEEIVAEGELPDVIFEEAQAAVEKLKQIAGLQIARQFVYNEDIKRGLVIDAEERLDDNGRREVLLTISLGSAELNGEYGIHGVNYMEVEVAVDMLLINYVKPLKDEDSFGLIFECQGTNGEWAALEGFETDYQRDSFTLRTKSEAQELASSDILISQTRKQTQAQSSPLRATTYGLSNTEGEAYEYPYLITVINVEKDNPSEYPGVTVSGVEEISWAEVEEEVYSLAYDDYGKTGICLYRISGSFASGKGYYLFEGEARQGQNRRIQCSKDGELVVSTAKPFDGSTVLARFIPLYGAGQDGEHNYWMQTGAVFTVDATSMMSEKAGNLKGMSVFDAVAVIAEEAGVYRYHIPTRFSFVYDDEIERGCIIEYYLEQDGTGGEVYLFNMVISNGKKGQADQDMIVPVQWRPGSQGEKGTYAALRYFTLPAEGNAGSFEGMTYEEVSNDQGQTWHGSHEMGGQGGSMSLIRGDGLSPDTFYNDEAIFFIDLLAEELAERGIITMGDDLLVRLSVGEPGSNKNGEVMTMEVAKIER